MTTLNRSATDTPLTLALTATKIAVLDRLEVMRNDQWLFTYHPDDTDSPSARQIRHATKLYLNLRPRLGSEFWTLNAALPHGAVSLKTAADAI